MQNQIFYVFYKDESFVVDPSLLYNSSRKFKELVDHADNLQSIHLKINYEQFSTRNVVNFLRLCQNEPTDVQNSELEEICLIAKMFQADQIYKTGFDFIKSSINPNFSIPENKFDDSNGEQYLIIESDEEKENIHHINLNELEFDDSCQFNQPAENEDDSKADNKNANKNINNKLSKINNKEKEQEKKHMK